MGPYFALAFGIVLVGFFLCELKQSKWRDLALLSAASAAMIGLSTVRADTVGVDYKPYLKFFYRYAAEGLDVLIETGGRYSRERGYGLLNVVISLFGQSQMAFALGISVVCVALTAVFCYKYSKSVWISLFVFVSFGFFGYTLCTLRNQLAICIYMFAIPFLQNRKIVLYMLITALSATFHFSMWFLIPVYFLVWIPVSWKSISFYGAGTLGLLIFSIPFINFVTQYVYKSYTPENYYMRGRDFRTSFVPIVLFAVTLLFQKKLLERDKRNLPLINLAMYCAALFVMTLKHFMFQRFALILFPVYMLLLPEMMQSLSPPPEKIEELENLKSAAKSRKSDKLLAKKIADLSVSVKDARTWYYTAIGMILVIGFLYLSFLMTANRLLLTPYKTIWS